MPSKKPYSIFKIRSIYHIQICYNYKRKTKTLKTSNLKEAHMIAKIIYPNILKTLITNKRVETPFRELVKKYLKYNHGWAKRTLQLYTYQLNAYTKSNTLPTNPTSRNMWVRCINGCWNWGLKQGLITKHKKLKQTISYPRTNILPNIDIIKTWEPIEFKAMCLIMAQAGARVEEIRRWEKTSKTYDSRRRRIMVHTKGTGQIDTARKHRIVLINDEIIETLTQVSIINFTRKNASKLLRFNQEDISLQLRDLRRTFAVNQYKKGIPLLTISRLMGHSSLSMTEWYLKPFTVEDIIL